MKRSLKVVCGTMMLIIAVGAAGCKKEHANAPVHQQKTVVKFSPAAPAALPQVQAFAGGVGNIEWVNGEPVEKDVTTVKRKKVLQLDGWAGDHVTQSVPPIVIVSLNSGNRSYYVQATRVATKRPDIAANTKKPAFEKSAFQLDADLSAVPPGDYMIGVLQSDGKKSIIGFDTKWHLAID